MNDLNITEIIHDNIDKTVTIYGRKQFRNTTFEKDKKAIINNINLIKYSNLNKIYFEKMREYLSKIDKIDDSINYWFNEKDDGSMFNGISWLNKPEMLLASNIFSYSYIFIITIIYIVTLFYNRSIGKNKSVMDNVTGTFDSYKGGVEYAASYVTDNKGIISMFSNSLALLLLISNIFLYARSIQSCVSHYKKCSVVQDHYENVATFIKIVEDMYNSDPYTEDIKIKWGIEHMKRHIKPGTLIGRTSYAKYIRDKYRDSYDVLANYIGAIDSLQSIHYNIKNGASVPDITDKKDQPYIKIENMWSPYDKTKKIIVKGVTVTMDKNENVYVISGGKKINLQNMHDQLIIRTLINNITIVHNIGFCCGKSMEFNINHPRYMKLIEILFNSQFK
jgi:hypothetical protein